MPRKLTMLLATTALIAATTSANAHQAVDKRLLNMIEDNPSTEIPDKPGRIKKGRKLFLEETFGGNGRTCGTCHEPTKNFTIDPQFIATLPQTSPLFVAETNPDLAELENPELMRKFGLILENLDGFENPGVMRGVPHTLGLPTSIQSDRGTPTRPPFLLANALGWSGDGAPGTGSLREFAVGAVVQHFTKTLLRTPNVDFRLPTKQELKAMEDFQLSLGRRKDINLDGVSGPAVVFNDGDVEDGKLLFLNAPSRNGGTRSCNACHANGGANDAAGNNRLFDTGVARAPTAPVCRGQAPGDGGFGSAPPATTVEIESICADPPTTAPVVFLGNGTFNTPSLVEAADTGPFFHNNSADTIEEAVAFYNSDAFNSSPAGGPAPGNAFDLTEDEIFKIAAMLRTINAMENVRNGIELDKRATTEGNAKARETIREALADTNDAINVLTTARIRIYQGTTIVSLLRQAAAAEQQALNPSQRKASLASSLVLAITRKNEAQGQFTFPPNGNL